MRAYQNGFEFPTVTQNRMISYGGAGTGAGLSTSLVRLDPYGGGGARSFTLGNVSGFLLSETWVASDEVFVRTPWYGNDSTSGCSCELYLNGAASGVKIALNMTTRKIDVTSGGVVRFSSTTTINALQWYRVEFRAKIAAAGTTNLELRIDGIAQGSSTAATNASVATVNQLRWATVSTSGGQLDDVAVNNLYTVVYFDGGAGAAPAAGDTVTSGAKSATIKDILGDGVTGYLVIANAGTAFADNDALTSGAWTANANGAEQTNECSWCGEGYIKLLQPNANGTTSGLTNSAGTSVNNYTYVDDLETTADYVSGAVDNLFDTYNYADLNTTQNVTIKHVIFNAYQQKTDETVPYLRGEMRVSGVDYASAARVAASTGNSWVSIHQGMNPSTLVPWTVAAWNASEFGPRVEAA